jgi:hypothetical protein
MVLVDIIEHHITDIESPPLYEIPHMSEIDLTAGVVNKTNNTKK